jgi:hypothetical protein
MNIFIKVALSAAITVLAGCASTGNDTRNAGIEGTGREERVAGIEGTGKEEQVAGIEGTGKEEKVAGIEGTGKEEKVAGIEGTGKEEKVAGIEGTGKEEKVAGIEGTGKEEKVAGIEGTGKEEKLAGIEGTGGPRRIVASGEVTALGSIVVHSIDFALNGARVTLDRRTGAAADLEVGQVVRLSGELDTRPGFARALRVDYAPDLAGPVSWIDPVANRAIVLGQTVRFDDAGRRTHFDSRAGLNSAASISAGTVVEVSGFYDSRGVLSARRVTAREAGKPYVISGVVARVDSAARRLEIGAARVNYATAEIVMPDGNQPVAGDELRIEAIAADTQGTLIATRVEQRRPRFDVRKGVVVMIEGWSAPSGTAGEVFVDGFRVRTPADSPLAKDAQERRFVRVIGSATGSSGVETLRVVPTDVSATPKPTAQALGCHALSGSAALACLAQSDRPAEAAPKKTADLGPMKRFYFGADIGMSELKIENGGLLSSEYRHRGNDVAWNLHGGWQVMRYFGLELGYQNLGASSFRLDQSDCEVGDSFCEPHDGNANLSALYFVAKGSYHFTPRFAGSAMVGASYINSRIRRTYDAPTTLEDSDTNDGLGMLYGFELAFMLRPTMDLHFSVRRSMDVDVGDFVNTVDGTSFSVGVRQRF